MGKTMAGTNEFAFFSCKSVCTGGGPESGRKNFEKCLPAGTGTKIYFSRTREIPTDSFPERVVSQNCFELLLSFSLLFFVSDQF